MCCPSCLPSWKSWAPKWWGMLPTFRRLSVSRRSG
nr:MAG TPA: hypothetical protein [Caudoviricetes sp.]